MKIAAMAMAHTDVGVEDHVCESTLTPDVAFHFEVPYQICNL
ncbi:MAG: hypothetical protein RIN55_06825 [Tissierellaceae bacterium]|nr:hypothetical protein [Tissierellaceae bacterium]